MTASRLFAIFVIFFWACVAWVILGGSVEYRTGEADVKGYEQVGSLWGGPQLQQAPVFAGAKGSRLAVVSSDITADFELEQRRKGLLWYATYVVDFAAEYGVRNDSPASTPVTMRFAFPDPGGVYDGFGVTVDGTRVPVNYDAGVAVARFDVEPGATAAVQTGYVTQGQNEWRYAATAGVGVIDDFALVMTTDFEEVDFPDDGVSPTSKTRTGSGWELTWSYESLVGGRPVALSMPTPLNPGPLASRISYFAPVSLLFYFAALILLGATRGTHIHPVNYGFLAAGFFAFHLLFAYLVDRVDIGVSFAIASVVSVGLCVAYLRMVIDDRRSLVEAALAQFIFLVLFSFSFFFEGYTGLAITIGAVLTLAYFMLRSGRTDWNEVFAASAQQREARKLSSLGYGQAVAPAAAVPGGQVAPSSDQA